MQTFGRDNNVSPGWRRWRGLLFAIIVTAAFLWAKAPAAISVAIGAGSGWVSR